MNIDRLMKQQGFDLDSLDDNTYDELSDTFDVDKDEWAEMWINDHIQEIAFEYAHKFKIKKLETKK